MLLYVHRRMKVGGLASLRAGALILHGMVWAVSYASFCTREAGRGGNSAGAGTRAGIDVERRDDEGHRERD